MNPRRVFAVALLVAAIALVSAAVATSRTPDVRKSIHLTADDALRAVERLIGDRGAVATGPFEARHNRFYAVEGASASATVDAFDGTVLTLLLRDKFPTSARISLDAQSAADAASRFLDENQVNVLSLDRSVQLIDHGDTQEYRVEWTRRVNGALVPEFHSVSVNPATGDAFGMRNFSRPFVNPLSPAIDRVKAEGLARAETGDGVWTIVGNDLQVSFDDQGTQLLVWSFEFSDRVAGAAVRVEVDAFSGLARAVARG